MEAEARTEHLELEHLQQEIDQWRRERPRMREMPAPLWVKATAIARKVGVYQAAKVLRLNYGALKQRISPHHRARRPIHNQFIEVKTPLSFKSMSNSPAVVEVVASDGTRLIIRLAETAIDLGTLIATFRDRR